MLTENMGKNYIIYRPNIQQLEILRFFDRFCTFYFIKNQFHAIPIIGTTQKKMSRFVFIVRRRIISNDGVILVKNFQV